MRKRGFTLIELLVVIAIIGILAATVLIGMRSARAKARDVQRKNNVRSAMNATESYFGDYDAYPDSTDSCVAKGKNTLKTLTTAMGSTTSTIYSMMGSPTMTSDDEAVAYGKTDLLGTDGKLPECTSADVTMASTDNAFIASDMEAGGKSFQLKSQQ